MALYHVKRTIKMNNHSQYLYFAMIIIQLVRKTRCTPPIPCHSVFNIQNHVLVLARPPWIPSVHSSRFPRGIYRMPTQSQFQWTSNSCYPVPAMGFVVVASTPAPGFSLWSYAKIFLVDLYNNEERVSSRLLSLHSSGQLWPIRAKNCGCVDDLMAVLFPGDVLMHDPRFGCLIWEDHTLSQLWRADV